MPKIQSQSAMFLPFLPHYYYFFNCCVYLCSGFLCSTCWSFVVVHRQPQPGHARKIYAQEPMDGDKGESLQELRVLNRDRGITR